MRESTGRPRTQSPTNIFKNDTASALYTANGAVMIDKDGLQIIDTAGPLFKITNLTNYGYIYLNGAVYTINATDGIKLLTGTGGLDLINTNYIDLPRADSAPASYEGRVYYDMVLHAPRIYLNDTWHDWGNALSLTLFESYTVNDDTSAQCYGDVRYAQIFTPTTMHTLTAAQLYLARTAGQLPGVITVQVRTVNPATHLPTATVVCSGTTNGNTLPEHTTSFEWREVTMGAGASVASGTEFAVVVVPSGDATHTFVWRNDGSAPAYAGGFFLDSTDAGATWNKYDGSGGGGYPDTDALFKEYGRT
jgi:hypothetical protein